MFLSVLFDEQREHSRFLEGARPYPAMSAKTVIGELRCGYRMPQPLHCRQELSVS